MPQHIGKVNPPAQFLSLGGRVVAELTATGILDRHTWRILNKPEPSIGYDVALLKDAERQGATLARNRDESGGSAYVTPIKRIWELGFERDFGWGQQIFLPIVYWDVVHSNGNVVPAQMSQARHEVQLSLFGEVA